MLPSILPPHYKVMWQMFGSIGICFGRLSIGVYNVSRLRNLLGSGYRLVVVEQVEAFQNTKAHTQSTHSIHFIASASSRGRRWLKSQMLPLQLTSQPRIAASGAPLPQQACVRVHTRARLAPITKASPKGALERSWRRESLRTPTAGTVL
jgi:hypothetical protein